MEYYDLKDRPREELIYHVRYDTKTSDFRIACEVELERRDKEDERNFKKQLLVIQIKGNKFNSLIAAAISLVSVVVGAMLTYLMK